MYAEEGSSGVGPAAGTAAMLGVVPVTETRVVALLALAMLVAPPEAETMVGGIVELSIVLVFVVDGGTEKETDFFAGADVGGLGTVRVEGSAIVGTT